MLWWKTPPSRHHSKRRAERFYNNKLHMLVKFSAKIFELSAITVCLRHQLFTQIRATRRAVRRTYATFMLCLMRLLSRRDLLPDLRLWIFKTYPYALESSKRVSKPFSHYFQVSEQQKSMTLKRRHEPRDSDKEGDQSKGDAKRGFSISSLLWVGHAPFSTLSFSISSRSCGTFNYRNATTGST